MINEHLPTESKTYTELVYREKEKWHRWQTRISLTKKIEALDRMMEGSGHIPKISGTAGNI